MRKQLEIDVMRYSNDRSILLQLKNCGMVMILGCWRKHLKIGLLGKDGVYTWHGCSFALPSVYIHLFRRY